MLFVVGDSNSVFTSQYLLNENVNRDLCKIGWTSDEVLAQVTKAKHLGHADAFFVFVGMNDRLKGEHITINILQIISILRLRRKNINVPIFLAPPFCVENATPMPVCNERREAARLLQRELYLDGLGTIVVTSHITKGMFAKKNVLTLKRGSQNVDPLHLNATGYMNIANEINQYILLSTPTSKRAHKPKKIYEAEPAPPPKVAWARARASI